MNLLSDTEVNAQEKEEMETKNREEGQEVEERGRDQGDTKENEEQEGWDPWNI